LPDRLRLNSLQAQKHKKDQEQQSGIDWPRQDPEKGIPLPEFNGW
jgi:hypothetical protein